MPWRHLGFPGGWSLSSSQHGGVWSICTHDNGRCRHGCHVSRLFPWVSPQRSPLMAAWWYKKHELMIVSCLVAPPREGGGVGAVWRTLALLGALDCRDLFHHRSSQSRPRARHRSPFFLAILSASERKPHIISWTSQFFFAPSKNRVRARQVGDGMGGGKNGCFWGAPIFGPNPGKSPFSTTKKNAKSGCPKNSCYYHHPSHPPLDAL